ncbi:tail fiber domain-containing protein [Candidatus Liberibacter africanus]|uniref:tail fiber domain-containing protein n=1 Tax=Liberibacter africanus TaxID=34020 RepID=UPI00339D3084
MGEVWTSRLAPLALQNLVAHAKTPGHIVYTADSNQYATAFLSSFMRELLSCNDDSALHRAIFKNGVKFYRDSQKIVEFMDDGDIMCYKYQKTVWQGIRQAQHTADNAENMYIKKTKVSNMQRGPGYIHFDTDCGPVGCSYFISDERLKNIHGKSSVSALESIEKLKFIDFNYIPEIGMDPLVRHKIGFSANNLQEVNKSFVDTIGDYLSPNPSFILPYLAKAVQELSQEVIKLRNIIDKKT